MNTLLQACESQGTYRIQEDVTDTQLMELVQMLPKRRLRKGHILGEPRTVAPPLYKPSCKTNPMKSLV